MSAFLPDQDEVPVGEALKLGSRYDNDEDEDDCSCRTDMAIMRASMSNIYVLAEEVFERRNIDDREGIIMLFQRFIIPTVGRGEKLLSNGYELDDRLSEHLLSLDVASRRQLVTELHYINNFRSLAEEVLGQRNIDDGDILIHFFEMFINPTQGRMKSFSLDPTGDRGERLLSKWLSDFDDRLRERLLLLDVASRQELLTQLEWAYRERWLHAFGPTRTSSGEAASDATEGVALGVNPNSGILRYGGNNVDVIANAEAEVLAQGSMSSAPTCAAAADQTQSQVEGFVTLPAETFPMASINEDFEDRKMPGDSAESRPDYQLLTHGNMSSTPTDAAVVVADADQSQVGGLVTLATETVPSTAAAGMDGITKSEDSEDRKQDAGRFCWK
jgi:hypothetical protein